MSKEIEVKKPTKKQALGRGLGSLLGQNSLEEKVTKPKEVTAVTTAPLAMKNKEIIEDLSTSRIFQVRIEKLKANKSQPRKTFAKESLEELSRSIKEQGILQPVVARKVKDDFEIIAGERRWRAAQLAGLHEVPVILKETDDQKTLELALIENIQRKI